MDILSKMGLLYQSIPARFFLTGHHIIMVTMASLFFNLQRSWFQFATAYAFALITELILYSLLEKNRNRSIFDVSFSAIAAASGLLILVRSPNPYFYIPLAILAVGGKYLFPMPNNRHVYNPTNFAICLALAFGPKDFLDLRSDEYSASIYMQLFTLFMGLFAVIKAKVWRITFGYFVSYTVLSLIAAIIAHESFYYFWGPELGAIGLIFMFLMISDPKTTPTPPLNQILFGLAVALNLITLRYYEVFFANFWALFITSTLYGLSEIFRQFQHLEQNA